MQSPLLSLPQECLELILRTLAHQSDLNSLFNLLCVNKPVCSATLPILYDGPLLLSVLNEYQRKDSPGFQRRLKLVSTLLLSVPETHVTDLLHATFPQDPVGQERYPTTPFAPYHSFSIIVSLHRCVSLYEGDFFKANHQPPQKLVDFVKEHGLKDRYIAETPLGRVSDESHWSIVTLALNRELRRDLTWALCSDVEHIRILTIPLSDIGRYSSLVNRFESLRDVTFQLDRYLSDEGANMDEITPEELAVHIQQRDERVQHLDQMVLFVQELRQRHKNVLQTAVYYGLYPCDYDWCPEEYQEKLVRLLPPLLDPQALGSNNWNQFATKVKETNLSAVKDITPPQNQPGALSLPRLLEKSPFLHRCRSLESIRLTSFPDDAFQWAVDERRQHDADIAAGRTPRRPLVPLQYAKVSNERPTDGRLINDIGYGFGETLKTLDFYSYATFDNQGSVVLGECSVGSNPSWSLCWHAPQLTNLLIRTDHNFLRIHPSLLAQCPQLKIINLVDRCHEYSASDITRWEPAELGQLETLILQGSPALSFNLETLNTARKLKTIELRMFAYYVPLVAELDEPEDDSLGLPPSAAATAPSPSPPGRPIWTWDWDLPKLTHLTLNGEMAYQFQFKMLQGTPSLGQLDVDIRPATRIHKRTLDVKEFLQKTQEMETMGGAQDDDDNNSNNDDSAKDSILGMPSKYIQLPELRSLTLRGTWVLDTEVLESLCRMVPGVMNMSLKGCGGFSLVDWVGTTSRLLMSISQAKATIPVAAELASGAGLVEMKVHDNLAYVLYQLGQLPVGRATEDKISYYFYL